MATRLPGVGSRPVLEALRNAAVAVENVRGAGGYPMDRFNSYQRWANEEARRLGGLVRAEDVNRLVTTARYWTLQSLDPATHGHLAEFVDLELWERSRDLQQACRDLDSYIARWASRRGLVVVADTNVYLHHDVYFDQVPWGTVVPARADGVHLVIPLLVVDELDRSKMSSRPNTVSESNTELVRTRARVTLRRFDELFANPGWTVTLQPDRFPETGAVTAELLIDDVQHRRLPDADSELVDRARAVQDLSGRPVYVVTFDTGMAFRARAAGLQATKL